MELSDIAVPVTNHDPQHRGHADAAEKARAHAEDLAARLEDMVRRAIARIDQADIPESVKRGLRAKLLSALDAVDPLAAVAQAMITAGREVGDEETKEYIKDMAELTAELYPSYAQYGKGAQSFIRNQLALALEHSPTLKLLTQQAAFLTDAEKSTAETQIAENFKHWKKLKSDPAFEEKYGPELIQVIEDNKLQRDPVFQQILEKIEAGESRGEVMRMVGKSLAQRVYLANAVAQELLPKLDQSTQDFYAQNYGKPPNMSAVLRDLNKLEFNDRNDAMQAYKAAGDDISKLPEKQQRIVHLMQLGIAIDTATELHAVMGMSKNAELFKVLNDREHDVDGSKRVAAIEQYMKQNSMLTVDEVGRKKMAGEIVRLLDEDPQARIMLETGNLQGLGKKLEEKAVQGAGHSTAALGLLTSAYSDAMVKGDLSNYRRSTLSAADLAREAAEWQAIDAKIQASKDQLRRLEHAELPAGIDPTIVPPLHGVTAVAVAHVNSSGDYVNTQAVASAKPQELSGQSPRTA